LSEAGNLFVWGSNYRDTLAIPDAAKDAFIVDISAGSQHYIALADTGELFFWGYNHQQQAQIHERFEGMFDDNPITYIKGGMERTLAITEDGSIYIWGVGANNLGEIMNRSPYRYFDEDGNQIKAVQLESNFNNVIVRLEDGTIRLIGLRSDVFATMPEELTNGSVNVVDVGLTTYNAFAIDSEGRFYAWGADSFEMEGEFVPLPVRFNAAQLYAGYEHVVVLTRDGELYAWGDNQLNQTNIPTIRGDVDQVFVGAFQNFVITDDILPRLI
jgi:peptide/nickel transport system permease protein